MSVYRICFSLLFLISLGIHSNAQQLHTPLDTSVFLEAVQMPAASTTYNLGFTAQALETVYVPIAPNNSAAQLTEDQAAVSLPALIDSLEQQPQNMRLVLQICAAYKQIADQQNYKTYLQYAFKNSLKAYEKYPDSFAIVSQLIEVLTEGGNYAATMQVYQKYIMAKPKDVAGLCRYAMQLIIAGNTEKAYHLLEQAHKLAPTEAQVYLGFLTYESTKILLQLSDITDSGASDEEMMAALDNMQVSSPILEKAIDENTSPAAQKALDAARLFLIYYRTVIKVASRPIGKEIIKLVPIKKDIKTMNSIERRAKKALKSSSQNAYYYYKVLTIIHVLEGKTEKADNYWKSSGNLLKEAPDVLRFLSLSHLLNRNFLTAISYLLKKQKVEYSYDDHYTLCRAYVYDGQLKQAAALLQKMLLKLPQDEQLISGLASIYFQEGKLQKGVDLLLKFEQEYPQEARKESFVYYRALASLLHQTKSVTCPILQSLGPENTYYESSQKLLQHFCSED